MHARKVNSYAPKLYPTCGALFGVSCVLCMLVNHHGFLVGRFSIYLLASTGTKREYRLCIQAPKPSFAL